MPMLLGILQLLGPYTWFIAGALLLIAEVVLPGLNLIWFGAAASLTGATLLVTDLTWESQLLAFIGYSVAAVLFGRLFYTRRDGDLVDKVNRGLAPMVGRELVLTEPIVNGLGRATVGDVIWRVSGPDLPAGVRVRVTGSESSRLLVEPAGTAAPASTPAAPGALPPER